MKKALFLLLLIPFSAMALNKTFLGMPPDKAYMNFVTTKFFAWHRKNFQFPEETPLMRELAGQLDHWLVPGLPLRQWEVSHAEAGPEKTVISLRLFVHPTLRARKELLGVKGKAPAFVEWNNQGRVCFVYPEGIEDFSVWCRAGNGKLNHEWDEKLTADVPSGWNFPFPYLTDRYLQKLIKGKVVEVTYFDVAAHPSHIPRALMRPVYLHTKDGLLPLDRVSWSRDGKMTVHYP
jgi:hypothetical protein